MHFSSSVRFFSLPSATTAGVLSYLVIDLLIEWAVSMVSDFSFSSFFSGSHDRFTPQFHLINLGLFSAEFFLVMVFYALIRPRFTSAVRARLVTIGFFLAFSFLFTGQMVNLGIYPPGAALLFILVTVVAFPAAVFAGTTVYDRKRKPEEHR